MTSVTISMDQLMEWSIAGYVWLHILFGLVTHYHSVMQVRQYNRGKTVPDSCRVGSAKMFILFAFRMALGFPWFVASRFIAPIGNRWHMSPEQIFAWG